MTEIQNIAFDFPTHQRIKSTELPKWLKWSKVKGKYIKVGVQHE